MTQDTGEALIPREAAVDVAESYGDCEIADAIRAIPPVATATKGEADVSMRTHGWLSGALRIAKLLQSSIDDLQDRRMAHENAAALIAHLEEAALRERPTVKDDGPPWNVSLVADLRAGKPVQLEAAAAIESLEREIIALRERPTELVEALRPFAEFADRIPDSSPDALCVRPAWSLDDRPIATALDFRRAKRLAALSHPAARE